VMERRTAKAIARNARLRVMRLQSHLRGLQRIPYCEYNSDRSKCAEQKMNEQGYAVQFARRESTHVSLNARFLRARSRLSQLCEGGAKKNSQIAPALPYPQFLSADPTPASLACASKLLMQTSLQQLRGEVSRNVRKSCVWTQRGARPPSNQFLQRFASARTPTPNALRSQGSTSSAATRRHEWRVPSDWSWCDASTLSTLPCP
jgi:hypothetical protein